MSSWLAGAHFVVALTGSVLTMPGLPKVPLPRTSTSTTTATSPACSKPAVHSQQLALPCPTPGGAFYP
ncbi:MAG: hypothetical protein ACLRM9_03935 [Collinsella aerofaciens]